MQLQLTSIQAFQTLNDEGIVPTQIARVYSVLKCYGSMTDKELQERTGYAINAVTARRNALYKQGKVFKAGLKYNKTGHKAIEWGAV